MDKEKPNSEISSVLQEFRKLLINHEESKKQQVTLKGLVETLRDALKVASDAEHNAEMKKSKSLGFVAQQQEVIVKLLRIKEENERLRERIAEMESRLSEIQFSRLSDQEKNDEEINNIKQEYLRGLMKAQEEGDVRVKTLEIEVESEIQGLKSEIESQKKETDEQSTRIQALDTEITYLKDKAAEDLEAYHNKLLEQDKVHQAELETWKVAHMKGAYNQNDINSIPHFSMSGPLNPMQISGSSAMYGRVLLPSEPNNYYRQQQLHNSMTHTYSGNHNNFPIVQNSSISQLPRRAHLTETSVDEYEKLQSDLTLQTENNNFHRTQNNLVSHLPGNNDHRSVCSNVNPQMPTVSVSRFPEVSNLYKLPTHTQSYPKLPLISRNRHPKSVSRVVRPLPRPKESVNAGFRKADEIYLEDKADDKDDGSADKTEARKELDDTELENGAKQNPLVPTGAKRRKLFNAERDSLLLQ